MVVPELKTLGRYTIERMLGRGSMGVVYEGVDPSLNRRVAIKTILKAQLDPQAAKDYSARFVREAHAVARLNHPHIVQVYDFGEEGEIAYLVMELIRGRELRRVLESGDRLELKEAVRIMRELLSALDYAHQAGIIHRDVKPGNVMLDADGRAKLADFGVARLLDSDPARGTQGGTVVGTPAYMSPEQISGAGIDKRTDIFSAGIVLYQFLTGELPFTGAGAWTVAKKIMQDEPAAPSTLNASLPPVLDAIVRKSLAKSPDTRYSSAKEFSAALQQAVDSMGAGADAEVEFWRTIKDSNEAAQFQLYLDQFPNGVYGGLARLKLQTLGKPASAPPRSDDTVRLPEAPRAPNRERRPAVLLVSAAVVIMVAAAAGWLLTRAPAVQNDPQVEAKAAARKLAIEKAAMEKAMAEKLAAERATLEKSLADKFAAEKLALERAAADRAAREQTAAAVAAAERAKAERVAAEKAAAERALAERTAFEKAAQAKAAADRAIADKAIAESRAAAERATAERLAAEKALALEKATAEKAAKVASVAAASAASSRFPREGDTWSYRLIQPDNRDLPQQRYTVTVTSASDTRIAERYSLESGKSGQTRHDKARYLSADGPALFSPYFAVFEDAEPGAALPGVVMRDEACPQGYACSAAARVTGRETVETAAGRFDAIRVTVDHMWQSGSGSAGGAQHSAAQLNGGRTLQVWYAPSVKRVVKATSRLNAGTYPPVESNFELELVSFKLH